MANLSVMNGAGLPATRNAGGRAAEGSADTLPTRGRPHRRSRGRNAPPKKDKGEPTQAVEAPHASPPETPTAKVAIANTAAAPQLQQQGCRVARTVVRWQRKGLAEAAASSSASGASYHDPTAPAAAALTATTLPLPLPLPPPPLPPIALPAWCRSSSAVAYPLSEDGLTRELVDFFHYTRLTPQEADARARLLRCVEASVDAVWNSSAAADGKECAEKTAQVLLYGSYALGLSLPSSDIDLALTFPAEERQEAEERRRRACAGEEDDDAPAAIEAAKTRQQRHLQRLHDLAEHLRSAAQTHLPLEVEVYDQCRIPRIHLKDTSFGGVSCDINSSLSSNRVACIVSRQRRWLRDAPLAAFLVRVTKAAVKQWGLNEVFAGGLASTALYCLVLRFLAQAEQLHRHAKVEEENLSPPRYDEATQSVSPLSASMCGSPLSPSSPTKAAATQPTFTNDFVAAAAIPAYVPSWLVKPKKSELDATSGSAGKTTPTATAATSSPASEECGVSETSGKAGSQGPWPDSGSGSSSSACNDDEDDSSEIRSLTQEPLTHASRTAESVKRSTVAVPPHDDYVTADELTRLAQARYGASPARLLLKLWRALSADAFLGGYQVADVFGDDAVWATSELAGFSGRPSAQPGVATLELATYACRSSTDLSAPSFRLPDLLALFRCSSSSLDNMLRFQRYPRRMAPTMLSTVFVDPRAASQVF